LGEFDRGSYVADGGYDIRVSERCLREDLGSDPGKPLERLAKHEIIKALCGKHEVDPTPPDTVGPTAGNMTLGVLRYGDDHRGATWIDTSNNALWLCAYGLHHSGQPNDAFPYFDELRAAGRIYPTNADREALLRDRALRLVDAIPEQAQQFVELARSQPGVEISRQLGPLRVRVMVTEADGIFELHVAIAMRDADPNLLTLALVGLCPEPDEFGAWREVGVMPSGPLDPVMVELGYSCLLPF
jgi:hypothetical protein